MSLSTGTKLAHFEILSPLGAGGMGEVYRARDTKLGREVAIKVLPDAVTLDAACFARFEREARILASLNEPGILTVHSIEDIGLCCFIVTELVEGRELTELVPAEGLPLDTFLDLALQLVAAIAAAHRSGVLHRDLKPANVMVTSSRRLKVLDFGLAKFSGGEEGVDRETPTQRLTQTGTVMGTYPYMSPEQLRGATVDERSDLFSLGIVLYEMAAGERPFAGATAPELASSILRDDPATVAARRPDLPRQLDRILLHCLQKDPDRRYRRAEDLLYDLEALRDETQPPRGKSAPPLAVKQAAAAGNAATISPLPSERAEGPAIEQEIRFCLTADGASIAYATVGDGAPPIVRSLGWFTHLELEWRWAAGRAFWERVARRHLLLRYDGRGMGLSQAKVEAFEQEQRLLDLEAVVDAAGIERFALMGMSEGGQTAIAYAARHPERVCHLVLYGTFVDDSHLERGDREKWAALIQLMKTGWGQETPVFRQIFSHLFLGTAADAEQIAYFNEMQRVSASAETAVAFLRATGGVDVVEQARTIRCPTLVLHRRGDLLVAVRSGAQSRRPHSRRPIPTDGRRQPLAAAARPGRRGLRGGDRALPRRSLFRSLTATDGRVGGWRQRRYSPLRFWPASASSRRAPRRMLPMA